MASPLFLNMYSVTTPPASEPISTADLKEHLRVMHTDDDDYIDSLAVAARLWIERQYDIATIQQTITEYFDEWDDVRLSVYPVTSITSVKYYDTDDSQQTLDSANYSTDLVSRKARFRFKTGVTKPSLYDRPNAIEVVYVSGYEVVADDIAHAIKLIVGDWYQDRERMPGNLKTRLLDTVERLLHVYA